MQRSCLIFAVSKAAAFAVFLLLFLLWAGANAAILRIMPLGDSITDGYTIPGGYRVPLCQMLIDAGYSVEFVGSMTDNNRAPFYDLHHEGHSGYRIDQITSGFPSWIESAGDPDIILLLIGTNDYGQKHDPAGAVARLDQLLAEIVALRPQARLVVANLLQRTDNRSADAAIQASFNPGVAALAQRYAASGRRVYFTDMRAALGAADLADGLHPNPTGYARMATNWFAVIAKIIAPDTAGGKLISFDGAPVDGSLNRAPLPAGYQPICGLTLGYENVGVFSGGPDHTSGVTGKGHYNTYSFNGTRPQIFTFSRPVAVPSVYVSTYDGGRPGTSCEVAIKAYSDVSGKLLITNVTAMTPVHPLGSNYVWSRCESLSALGSNIMRLEFFSPGNAQVDDMLINVATNLGPVEGIHLSLPAATSFATRREQATVTADYLYASNLDVTASAGMAYGSSDTNVAMATGPGVIESIHTGTTVITARFQGCSNSLPLTVAPGALMDFNNGLGDMGERATVPVHYQPVPGLTIGCKNVGLFNGGPDHTRGMLGGNNYNAYQLARIFHSGV
jgi:lysophospholipase L1-like esterase